MAIEDFRKLRLGFVNLVMLGNFEKEAEEEAVRQSNKAKNSWRTWERKFIRTFQL